jgi:hypothetical protein
MPTTTNYGWTTPADTDLVKDGAAAIRTLGSSIDTTVFNNASAGIPKTIVDAKGDLIAATASDTVARLAIGTNNQVLTADSTAATGMKWATPSGGWTLLATATLSGSTGVSFTSIPTTYSQLRVICNNLVVNTSTVDQWMFMRFNNDSTAGNYIDSGWVASGGTNRADDTAHGKAENRATIGAPVSNTNLSNEPYRSFSIIEILNANDTTTNKMTRWTSLANANVGGIAMMGRYKGTSAISQIDFIRNSTSTYTGTVFLYGM